MYFQSKNTIKSFYYIISELTSQGVIAKDANFVNDPW